jgi:hypothetical protein
VNDDELLYRRVFCAPRELVWRCLTEPAELAHFWGPRSMATPIDGIIVELHAGGRFETLMLGGLTVRPLSGHTWGWVVCSCGEHVKVFSTGRNPEQGAKLIRRFVVKHSDHAKEVER